MYITDRLQPLLLILINFQISSIPFLMIIVVHNLLLFFDTILDFSNNSCRNFCCLFFVFNYIILNNRLRHNVVADLLPQPLLIVIKLHSFLVCNIFCIQFSIPRGIQVFSFIPCYFRSSLIFLFVGCFMIIILKYNLMFFIVVILQFIFALFFF